MIRTRPEVFFAIPLLARRNAGDWSRVVHHLEATLISIFRQSDPHFRALVACHDVPELSVAFDDRLEFLPVGYPPVEGAEKAQIDMARKRARIMLRIRELGGGYVALSDADDLFSNRFVAYVRETDHPNGYLIEQGYIFDSGSGLLTPLPFAGNTKPFDQVCGSGVVVRCTVDDLPSGPRDDCRYRRLTQKGHAGFRFLAEAEGRPLFAIPFRAAVYVMGTGNNLSHTPDGAARPDEVAAMMRALPNHKILRTEALETEFSLCAAEPDKPRPAPVSTLAAEPGEEDVTLSVVIATHRRPDGLATLLNSVAKQVRGHAEREIVVVNDGTHDERYETVVKPFRDIVRYEALPENVGVGEARNRGAALARNAYIVYTDDDCEPPDWWLDWLAARLKRDPGLDVIAGTTRPLWTERRRFLERVQAHYQLLPHPWGAAEQLNIFVTANVAIRRSLFDELGGFAALKIGEDTELSLRLAKRGARSAIDYSWYVRHAVGGRIIDHVRRYGQYGRANVLLTKLPSASPIHLAFAKARFRNAPGQFLKSWRAEARRSEGFSANRMERWASVAVATAIRFSHYLGCARGSYELGLERARARAATKPAA